MNDFARRCECRSMKTCGDMCHFPKVDDIFVVVIEFEFFVRIVGGMDTASIVIKRRMARIGLVVGDVAR